MLNLDLQKRVALVTGASGGLGQAIATTLAAAGARVAVHYGKDAQGAAQVVESIRQQGGEAQAFAADVADVAAVRELVAAVEQRFGSLDILVNNAGMDGPHQLVGADDDPKAWEKVLAVDLLGPYYTARAAIPIMERQKRGV
ncbi:MAG: SDR family NAD(P)-dependent oxidoreductase, partial [Acidithiobacillus sp.]|uniref:SDR family NAD(P)-dependent oxidoreductase n=1 Tax=Acidithiobacillus sp. TaxID=1872118 RepID=UPI003D0588BA